MPIMPLFAVVVFSLPVGEDDRDYVTLKRISTNAFKMLRAIQAHNTFVVWDSLFNYTIF
jgi:hypothetical protein